MRRNAAKAAAAAKKAEAEAAIARQDITWPTLNSDDMVINCHAPYTGTFSVPFTPGQAASATNDGRRRLGYGRLLLQGCGLLRRRER